MKPALFNVLCEIKEKTGMFILISQECVPLLCRCLQISSRRWREFKSAHTVLAEKPTEAQYLLSLSPESNLLLRLKFTLEGSIQSQHNSPYKFQWHVRHVFPHVAPKSACFSGFTIGTVDNYLQQSLSIIVSKYEWGSFLMLLWNNREYWAKIVTSTLMSPLVS